MPDHPDSEQLAAYQAGDGDRRQRADVEAHLAGCPACAEVVASVEQARGRLALLEEPDLPPGLHDRLAAALDAEAAGSATDRSADLPAGRPAAGQRRPRPAPWYRRPVAWGAAAALLLAALVAVPLLDQSSDVTTAGGAGGGAGAARQTADADAAGAGSVPLLRIPGEVSAATVRSRLASDSRARRALDSATAGSPGSPGGETAVPQDTSGPATATQSPDQAEERYRSSVPAPAAGSASLRSCLPAAAAAADPATRPLTPAFYVEGTYQGREATILVTTSAGQQGRVDLWVFPRNDCSSTPLATERVR